MPSAQRPNGGEPPGVPAATLAEQRETLVTTERELREKLRKIEALFAGAGTAGERAAAEAAAERIRARLAESAHAEAVSEIKFSVLDAWSRQLFCALCRRYGLTPYRYPRMHRQSILVRAPASFVETVLWPEFEELDEVLRSYLAEITDRIVREAIHGETGDADEVPETGRRQR